MTAIEKNKYIGYAFWIYGGIILFISLSIVAIAFIGTIVLIIWAMTEGSVKASDFGTIVVFLGFVLAFFAMPIVFGIFCWRGGKRLVRRERYGFISALTAMFLIITHIPFGTAIAGYFLIFALSDEGKEFYQDEDFAGYGFLANVFKPSQAIEN